MEHMDEIKNLILENQGILSRFIKEIQEHNVSLETVEQEVKFLKDLYQQLSVLVKDDADNSVIIRLSRLEGTVEEVRAYIASLANQDTADKKQGNNRYAIIIALLTSITSLLSQLLEAIFGKH